MSDFPDPIEDGRGVSETPAGSAGVAGWDNSKPARGPLLGVLLGYSALRFGLTAVLTVGLMFLVPLIIAMAVAVIVQLPLSMLLFHRQREAARAALVQLHGARRAERAELRGALYGERSDGDATADRRGTSAG